MFLLSLSFSVTCIVDIYIFRLLQYRKEKKRKKPFFFPFSLFLHTLGRVIHAFHCVCSLRLCAMCHKVCYVATACSMFIFKNEYRILNDLHWQKRNIFWRLLCLQFISFHILIISIVSSNDCFTAPGCSHHATPHHITSHFRLSDFIFLFTSLLFIILFRTNIP